MKKTTHRFLDGEDGAAVRVGEEAAAAEAEEDAVDPQQQVARGGVRDGEVVARHAERLGHGQRRLIPRAEARVHHRQRRHRVHPFRQAESGGGGSDRIDRPMVGMGARVFPRPGFGPGCLTSLAPLALTMAARPQPSDYIGLVNWVQTQ